MELTLLNISQTTDEVLLFIFVIYLMLNLSLDFLSRRFKYVEMHYKKRRQLDVLYYCRLVFCALIVLAMFTIYTALIKDRTLHEQKAFLDPRLTKTFPASPAVRS